MGGPEEAGVVPGVLGRGGQAGDRESFAGATWMTVKVEEGATSQEVQVPKEAKKGKKIGFLLEPSPGTPEAGPVTPFRLATPEL